MTNNPLRYVGRTPDSTGVVSPISYAQSAYAVAAISNTWIDGQVTIGAKNLVNQAYVNQQVADYVTRTQVTTAIGAHVPSTALNAVNGVGQLDVNGLIPSIQLPTLVQNNLATNVDAASSGQIFLAPGVHQTVYNNTIGEFALAQVTVPDPGYSWIPWPFAYVQGMSTGTGAGNRLSGSSVWGLLAVTTPGAQLPIYGAAVMTDDPYPNYYPLVPYGAATGPMTPLTQPATIGSLTLELSACCWEGSGYTVTGTGLIFYVLCLPAPALGGL